VSVLAEERAKVSEMDSTNLEVRVCRKQGEQDPGDYSGSAHGRDIQVLVESATNYLHLVLVVVVGCLCVCVRVCVPVQ
jgi:hypothetical protein